MFSSSSTSCSSSQLVVDFSSQCMVAVGFAGDFRARAKQSFSLPSPSSSSSNLAKLRLCFTDMFSELFFQRVQMKSLKQLRVLVIEPHTLWPACYRDALYTSLFVDFQVAAVCMQPASYLSLLASGTTSGILVNLGEEESHVLAFAFGRAVLPTLQVSRCGKNSMLLDFKEKANGEKSFEKYVSDMSKASEEEFESDIIYSGLLSGYSEARNTLIDENGLLDTILRCLLSCNRDLRLPLSSRIIVCGPTDVSPALSSYITSRLQRHCQDYVQFSELSALLDHIQLYTPTEACSSELAFLGGSLFAFSADNAKKYITREDLLPAQSQSASDEDDHRCVFESLLHKQHISYPDPL